MTLLEIILAGWIANVCASLAWLFVVYRSGEPMTPQKWCKEVLGTATMSLIPWLEALYVTVLFIIVLSRSDR